MVFWTAGKVQTGNPAMQQIAAAQAELNQNLAVWQQQYQAFTEQKNSGAERLASGQAEIDRNRAELTSRQTQMQQQETDAAVQFADAQRQIDDGWLEYQDGLSTLEQEKADSDRKLADAETEIADAEQELEKLSSPKGYAFDRTYYPGYAEYGTDAERVDNIARVFPVFFILVAMLVCLTTMTRMVEEHRTQIGTLKALGYSKAAIIGKYLIYAIAASFLGSIAGVLLCSKLFPLVIFEAYRIMYVMPDLIAPIRWDYAIFSTIIAVLCTSLAAFLSCYAELFAPPAQLMRPKSPKAGKRVFLEKIPFLWNRLSFIYKVTIRNIFRYKKRVIMTVIGIAGCTALMLAGFGLQYAIASIVPKQFEEIFLYDVIVMVQDDLSTEEKQQLSNDLDQSGYISDHMPVLQKTLDASGNGATKGVTMFVLSDPTQMEQYISLQERESRKKLTLNDQGVIINEKLAKLLQLEVGDSIELSNENGGVVSAVVSGITENYTMNFVYLTPNYYEAVFETAPDYNGVVINMSMDDSLTKEETKEALSVELISHESILGLSFSDDNSNSFRDIVSSLNYIVLLIIVSAGALAFVVLYNLVNVNVAERTRELATIKVLGFYDKEVSSYVYRENVFCTILGILGGFILGVYLERFIVQTAEVDAVMFTPGINFMSYVYAAALTLLFTVMVNFVLHFKLKKLDMVESMKSIE